MVPADRDARPESVPPAKRARMSPGRDNLQTEDGGLAEEKPKAEELKSPNSSVRESTRLKNKATVSAKAKQDCARAQQDSDSQPPSSHHHSQQRNTAGRSLHNPQQEVIMEAARAAARVKHACTIDENELLALRPTLLRGYASIHDHQRDEALEADLKSLLYYFRHHTVEPEILKRLCFVEIVYSLQNHANRLVADLAAQLITLGPWKIVYNQLRQLNPAWFQQHAIHFPEQPVNLGAAAASGAVPVPVAAALQKQASDL